MRKPRSRSGFTLLELLVVIGIATLLSGMAIVYSGESRDDIALTVEESKIAQFILQARQLSIATYGTPGSASCGYGVVFNFASTPQTYSIFSYSPIGAPPCPSLSTTTSQLAAGIGQGTEKEYTQGTWDVPVSQGVVINHGESDSLAAVLFYPPDPVTFLSHDGQTFSSSLNSQSIYLTTADGKNSVTLSINAEGQVNF